MSDGGVRLGTVVRTGVFLHVVARDRSNTVSCYYPTYSLWERDGGCSQQVSGHPTTLTHGCLHQRQAVGYGSVGAASGNLRKRRSLGGWQTSEVSVERGSLAHPFTHPKNQLLGDQNQYTAENLWFAMSSYCGLSSGRLVLHFCEPYLAHR